MTIDICKNAFREARQVFPFLCVQSVTVVSAGKAQAIVKRFHVSSFRWRCDLPCLGDELTLTIFDPRPPQHAWDSLERCFWDSLAKGPDDLCWLLCIQKRSSSSSTSWMSNLIIKSQIPGSLWSAAKSTKPCTSLTPSCECWIHWWMEQGPMYWNRATKWPQIGPFPRHSSSVGPC